MSDLERLGESLRPYEEIMRLKWEPEYAIVYPLGGPRVVSLKEKQRHLICFPVGLARRVPHDPFMGMMVLAKAKLGEALDPIFATATIHPFQDNPDEEGQERKTRLLLAQQVTNVWALDAVAGTNEGVLKRNAEEWWKWFIDLPEETSFPLGATFASSYAFYEMQVLRYQLERLFSHNEIRGKLERILDFDKVAFIRLLANFYARLPILSGERDIAFQMLEQQTQKAAVLWGFQIKPVLQEFEGEMFWSYK